MLCVMLNQEYVYAYKAFMPYSRCMHRVYYINNTFITETL